MPKLPKFLSGMFCFEFAEAARKKSCRQQMRHGEIDSGVAVALNGGRTGLECPLPFNYLRRFHNALNVRVDRAPAREGRRVRNSEAVRRSGRTRGWAASLRLFSSRDRLQDRDERANVG